MSDAPTDVPAHRDFRGYSCNGGRGAALEAGMSRYLDRWVARTSWSRPRLRRTSYAIAANVIRVINVVVLPKPTVPLLPALLGKALVERTKIDHNSLVGSAADLLVAVARRRFEVNSFPLDVDYLGPSPAPRGPQAWQRSALHLLQCRPRFHLPPKTV
jgi:hypothetical protein